MFNINKFLYFVLTCYFVAILCSCESEDPRSTVNRDQPSYSDVSLMTGDTIEGHENALNDSESSEELNICMTAQNDYPSAAWDACVSDGGQYVLAGPQIPSSAARTTAYEVIADLLWRNDRLTPEDFISAQLIFAEEGGLGSRVTRRYDAHVTPPMDADCTLEDAGDDWPEYCVGPGLIQPLLYDHFDAGSRGEALQVNAATIRAGLLWFFYLSIYKEAYTCRGKAADCDSSWAYHNGGKQRNEAPVGFGAELANRSPKHYERLFTANLAVRCWRDLDASEQAENQVLHQRALIQLDAALDRGLGVLLITRLEQLQKEIPTTVEAQLRAELAILGPVLNRALVDAEVIMDTDLQILRWNRLSEEDQQILYMQLSMFALCESLAYSLDESGE